MGKHLKEFLSKLKGYDIKQTSGHDSIMGDIIHVEYSNGTNSGKLTIRKGY